MRKSLFPGRKILFIGWGVLLSLGADPCSARAVGEPTGTQIQLEKLLLAGSGGSPEKSAKGLAAEPLNTDILALYRNLDFRPIWVSAGRPTQRAAILRSFLDASGNEGMQPQHYHVAEIGRLWRKSDDSSQARLELTLTRAFAKYVSDVSNGRNDIRRLDEPSFQQTPPDDRLGFSNVVRKGLDSPDLERFLRLLPPQDPDYQQLRVALQRYRSVAQKGGWKAIPAGTVLKRGMGDPRIPLVRQRLALTADLGDSNLSSMVFDKELESAVRRFQIRHYLSDDGVIGAATIFAMNVSVEKRIQQIIINMERGRWSSLGSSGKQIFVNIPGFDLSALRDGRVDLTMPVVVGKSYQQTPVFDDQMEYLEFNPDWLVPPAIVASEYLPDLRKDPASLSRKHIRIFEGLGKDAPEVDPRAIKWSDVTPATMVRYALRQDPGPWNALGTLKFMFPNKYNVYFHDTSEPRFFAERQRTFSHGCIRVSRPYELAAWVLEEKSSPWSIERIHAAVAGGQRTTVRLGKPIPVHLVYRTALIGEDKILHFRPDIYGRDAVLEKALFDS